MTDRKSWDSSTDKMPVAGKPAVASDTMGGVVIKAAGQKWVIPTAQVLGMTMAAAGMAWSIAQSVIAEKDQQLVQMRSQIYDHERKLLLLDQRVDAEAATLAEIRTQLSEIRSRVAEIQVTLMRRGHGDP